MIQHILHLQEQTARIDHAAKHVHLLREILEMFCLNHFRANHVP